VCHAPIETTMNVFRHSRTESKRRTGVRVARPAFALRHFRIRCTIKRPLPVLVLSINAGSGHFLTVISSSPNDQAKTVNATVMQMAQSIRFAGE
jgi:hypothetical protein